MRGSESLLMDVCMTRIRVYPTQVGMSRLKTFTIFLHGCLSHIGGNESIFWRWMNRMSLFIPHVWEWLISLLTAPTRTRVGFRRKFIT